MAIGMCLKRLMQMGVREWGLKMSQPIIDRKKHRQEVESLKADNRMKDMELGKAYVDEFRSNIARPLQEEVKDLRMEIAQLRNAIQRIGDCPHSAACPVRDSLQHESQGD